MTSLERRDLLELIGPLYRGLRRAEERCAREAGLSMWQYAVLSVAARDDGLSQTEIADRLAYSRNRIVNDLDLLEARGLAERRAGADRRRYSIAVTPAGRDAVAGIRAAIWSAEDALLSHLPAAGRESLQELLHQALGRPSAPEPALAQASETPGRHPAARPDRTTEG
ncbi:MarR family winged helix-turn-helix transcriptional regulator [Krasilnikoviella flava]|uniref:DNA-binding transcriptional regulator, MarR family n=1 Tax=Krasilnikoviella flava TaxID=526729 RepID=A0A1T5KYW0_9MICO|nr:MarR family transcriptional regulator [Krasilnikoviella flava]SKC69012.1 DNA-binding transcriptional regulator, MarR family [Krasilnikoviella flava]